MRATKRPFSKRNNVESTDCYGAQIDPTTRVGQGIAARMVRLAEAIRANENAGIQPLNMLGTVFENSPSEIIRVRKVQ